MKTIKGFTLIEMVIVMVVSSILLAAVSTLLAEGFQNYFEGVAVTGLSNQGSVAMLRMSKELKEASSFSAITATNVTFQTTSGSTISYSFSGSTLTRTGLGAQTLATQVSGFSLAYYQANFSTTASTANLRAITITLTLNDGNESTPFITTVYLSNML